MLRRAFFLCASLGVVVTAPAAVHADEGEEAPRVVEVEVQVDRPKPGEPERLGAYLLHLRGLEATEAVARRAEAELLRLARYRSAVCRTSPKGSGARLKCGVARARTIRRLRIEGLPAGLLESDLRKRIFLRPGEVLDRPDASGRDRVTRQRERIEQYLEREGFFGAEVEVLTPPVSRTADVDVFVRIRGGSFVRVRDVDVEAWLPLDRQELEARFGALCGTPDEWITALETGQLACFTQARLREVVERFEERLRERGFPEGRVQVDVSFVDPVGDPKALGPCAASNAERARYREVQLAPPPRCVDLKVRVHPGPRIDPLLVIHDGDGPPRIPMPHDPARDLAADAYRKIASWFFDPISRGLQAGLRQPVATSLDTEIRLLDLREAFTFAASGAADEVEAELTRQALEEVLERRGYFNARVELDYRLVSEERVDIRYDIWPGEPLAIRKVRLLGNVTFTDEEILDEVKLAARPRSPLHPGFVTRQELEDDRVRLQSFYEGRGFADAVVLVDVVKVGAGQMDVHFRIDERTRYVLGGVRLEGGVPALTPEVLKAIAQCGGGPAADEEKPPVRPEDCVGMPFLDDELEADAQRVVNVYVRHGYPYARAEVGPSPEWTEQGPVLLVKVWQGEEADKPPSRVERGVVFLEGNTKTARDVILKDMGLDDAPGELLDPIEISKGVSRLRRTGLFSRVNLTYLGVEAEADEVDLLLQLEERPSLTLDTALGFSTDNLFGFRTELRDKNFLGLMLDVSTLADLGLFIGRTSQAQAQVRWPRILGSEVDAVASVTGTYEDHPSPEGQAPRVPAKLGPVEGVVSWEAPDLRRRILTVGTTVGLDWRPLPERLPGLVAGLDYELRLEWDDPAAERIPVFSPRAFATLDGLLEVTKQDISRVALLSPRVRYTSVDNPFDPTSGWSGEMSPRLGGPWLGGTELVALASGRGTLYIPFGEDLVLALNARAWLGASFLDGARSSVLLRPELLLLGGDRTVRGYSEQRPFGLRALPTEVEERERDRLMVAGGVANIELRQTWVRNFFLGDLKTAYFLDLGFVTDSLSFPSYDPFSIFTELAEKDLLGFSFGAGLRYVLPVGPISFDVAYAPLRGVLGFHLRFGYAF